MKILKMGLLPMVLMMASVVSETQAGMKQVRQVEDAIAVIHEFSNIPENQIPPTLLRDAVAIAVIPDVIKVGLIIGGNYGSGVISVRDNYGYWTNPVFITLTGGSIGWQIGAQSADIILVFKSIRSIHDITAGKFTLGGDASVAVGPVGREIGAGTDVELNSEIYSFSRTRGLFAGVSLQGAALEIDYDGIAGFYDNTQIGAKDVFETPNLNAPQVAADFRLILTEQARR
jgi:lipid-binding SYLF domain-containing protein